MGDWLLRWTRWLVHDSPTTVRAPRPWAVLATSDVHTDFPANMNFIENIPYRGGCQGPTALIVSGDVSHHMSVIESTLRVLLGKFDAIFYTIGNHELWDMGKPADSLNKLLAILELCDELGVHTRPTALAVRNGPPDTTIDVVPLFSWYSENFYDSAPCSEYESMFDGQCFWPAPVGDPDKPRLSLHPGLAPFFADLNEQIQIHRAIPRPPHKNEIGGRERTPLPNTRPATMISQPTGGASIPTHAQGRALLSFSHFIPDPDLYWGRGDLKNVMGSLELKAQVERLAPAVHVFGHSHLPCDTVRGPTRFVQSALGYPKNRTAETRNRPASAVLKSIWPPAETQAGC